MKAKKMLIMFIICMAATLAACGGYDKEFQEIQDLYIAGFSMYGNDHSIIDLYMYTYAEDFEEAYNSDFETQIPENFIHSASYALATMNSTTNAYKVCSLTWDAFYAYYKGDLDKYRNLMDRARSAYEKAIGMSMEDYLATVSDQDIMNSFKIANYSGSKIWK